jgi:hypothetical protein
MWDKTEWVNTAKNGTSRQQLAENRQQHPEFGVFIKNISPESQVLRAGIILGYLQRAGYIPQPVSTLITDTQLADAEQVTISTVFSQNMQTAEPETKPYLPENTFLYNLLNSSSSAQIYHNLFANWIQLAAATGYILKPELLSSFIKVIFEDKILEKNPAIAGAVVELIGQRGKWVAALNPEWHVLIKDQQILPDSTWQMGSIDQRVAYLRQLRKINPVQACQLLTGNWHKENKNNRAAFLKLIEENLLPQDRPILEIILTDKVIEFRKRALAQLAKVGGHALIDELIAYVHTELLISGEYVGFNLPKPDAKKWEDFGLAFEKDKPAAEKDLLIHILGFVPPDNWPEWTDRKPYGVLAAFRHSDWKNVFLLALASALKKYPSIEWSLAVFEYHIKNTTLLEEDLIRQAIAILITADIEKLSTHLIRFIQLYAADKSQLSNFKYTPLYELLTTCPEWTTELTKEMIILYRDALENSTAVTDKTIELLSDLYFHQMNPQVVISYPELFADLKFNNCIKAFEKSYTGMKPEEVLKRGKDKLKEIAAVFGIRLAMQQELEHLTHKSTT